MTVTVHKAAVRGFLELHFEYDATVISTLKALPGAGWNAKKRCWIVPEELVTEGLLDEVFERPVVYKPNKDIVKYSCGLREYQERAIAEALDKRSYIIGFDRGIGKTATALGALSKADVKRVLIVCPGSVRETWREQANTWWPDCSLEWQFLETEKAAEELTLQDGQVAVVSYMLLPFVAVQKFDAIVFDEIHLLANEKAARTRRALAISAANLDSLKLGLTATFLKNEAVDLWAQVAVLWPRPYSFYKDGRRIEVLDSRFGTKGKFLKRYSGWETNKYGSKPKGLNEIYGEELKTRLASLGSFVQRGDVGDLLPPVEFEYVRLPFPESGFQNIELLNDKLEKIIPIVEERVNGRENILICCRLRDTATYVSNKFSQKFPTYLATGALPPKKRQLVIEEAKLGNGTVLVTNIEAVGLGINSLVDYGEVFFIELHPSPEKMLQVFGRWGRLNSTKGTKIYLYLHEESQDARTAELLLPKLEVIASLFGEGRDEAALGELLVDDYNWEELSQSLGEGADEVLGGELW